ncbi:glycosyl-hydrolase [Coprinopsis cinerea AmutBmut pab1-1]|nr:glycosyl-hydrolase [Coprinopsis cinerea AmutBmut pab1-1]
MRPPAVLKFALFLLFSTLGAGQQQHIARVLVYSATTGFRHDSIPTAIEALEANAESINSIFESTEDRGRFTDEYLSEFDAVVFLSTTGDVLDESGRAALQTYLNSGGNFVGIHSASDCLRNTSFFVRELGARFDYHADLQEANLDVIGPPHPSTEGLPSSWRIRDEMYNFDSDPRSIGATVILAADESSYVGKCCPASSNRFNTMKDNGPRRFDHGTPHPIAWFQVQGAGVEEGGIAGRSFYTSLGHLNETWEDPVFLSHVLGGISWVLQSNTTKASNLHALVGNPESVPIESSSTTGGGPGSTETSPTASVLPTAGDSDDSSAHRVLAPFLFWALAMATLSSL